MDSTADSVLQVYDQLVAGRGTLEADLQDIVDLVRPAAAQFNRAQVDGEQRWQYKYDGTAIDSLNEFSSGLCSYLTNPTERWFELEFVDYDVEFDEEAAAWLQTVTELVYEAYRYPLSGFQPTIHEAFLDVGSLGTCIVDQEIAEDEGGKYIGFQLMQLAQTYIMENEFRRVDSVFRTVELTKRNLLSKFGKPGDFIHPAILRDTDVNRRWPIIHAVFPRKNGVVGGISTSKPYASVWVDRTHRIVVRESGFDFLPYHVGRWIRCGNEPYGRSPAHTCLPEIRMVNSMERVNIRAGQKLVDPPLQVPDDGFIAPIKTHPGALLYRQPGAEEIVPLVGTQQLPVVLEMTEQKRDAIRKAFHVDWLKLGKENKEMTRFEADDRRQEKLRGLAPILGRLQSEFLGPMIETTYKLLVQLRVVPPPPGNVRGRPMRISYVGGAAKAQMGMRAVSTARFLEDLMPMAQLKPEILDVIDEDALTQEMALSRGVPRSILRDPRQLAEIRQQRQAQQAVAAAEPASKALKNVADARQTGAI